MKFEIKKGFTLIELLVSICIISILIVSGIPYYHKFIQSSEINSSLSSLNFYKTSIVVCIQTKNNPKVCDSGNYSIPEEYFKKKYNSNIKGFNSIVINNSVIYAISETFLSELNDYINIKYTPIIKENLIEWEISCNDYSIGSIVDNCSKEY